MKRVIDYFQILLIFLLTFISSLLGLPLLIFGTKKALKYISSFWSFLLLKICRVQLKTIGNEKINYESPKIYVCNHESNIDIPCLMQAIDEPLFFVAKKELKHIPFMGWYMLIVGMIFVDRGNKQKAIESMKNAGEEVKNGKSIFSFPEGTRTLDGKVGLFKRGTFQIAINSGVEIIPIAIKGAKEIIPAKKFEINKGSVIVKIGEPIRSNDWKMKDVDEMAAFVRSKVIKLRNDI